MYIVYRAYDDKTADILGIGKGNINMKRFSEEELINFTSHHDVIGVSASDKRLNYINAYDILQFPTEDEATEFCHEHGISYKNKIYIFNYWYVFERSYITYHVSYFIRTAKETDNVYLGKDIKYTPYMQAAKEFTKDEAQKKVDMMSKNPRAAQNWTIERIVCR